MVMVLEELCQRNFTQEEEVEVSCNERGECGGGWKTEHISPQIIESKN